MENTPYLYDTLPGVLGQHSKWLDLVTDRLWLG